MNTPIISVILPTRNRNHLLPRALDSLYAQTFRDFEIILVDDNDSTRLVKNDPALTRFLTDRRLVLIKHESPRNAATARNCGLKNARGRWVTYLDDDDAYHPLKLEKQLRRAEETQLPLGLCGLVYNLHGRRRFKQTNNISFCGEALLLDASPDTKAIFHKKTDRVCFDQSLDAAEDVHYFFQLVRHFKINCVFNVPEALIEVFPQQGTRVNLNGPAIARATETIYTEFAVTYGEKAAKIYLSRTQLQASKFKSMPLTKMLRISVELIRLRGIRESRLIANTFAFKIPPLRKFLVS